MFLAALAAFALCSFAWRWSTGGGAHKFSPRHLLGGLIGCGAIVFAGVSLLRLAGAFEPISTDVANSVTFLAPVQQAASALTAEVANVPANTSTLAYGGSLTLVLLAVVAWILGAVRGQKSTFGILGWTLLAWATLRLPNGAPGFLAVLAAFLVLRVVIPALNQLWRVS